MMIKNASMHDTSQLLEGGRREDLLWNVYEAHVSV